MPEEIHDPLAEIDKNREKFQSDYENEQHRLFRAAYETFENSKYGPELLKYLQNKLYAPVGPDVDAKYMTGQHDMIRMILGWITSYELLARGIKHG